MDDPTVEGSAPRLLRVSRRLPPRPQSAREARLLAREALADWGLDRAMDVTELIVSELVANAVRHAESSMLVDVETWDGQTVRVSVTDGSRRPPQNRTVDPSAEDGRGVHLVAQLSDRWGTDPLPGGKRVWAEVHA